MNIKQLIKRERLKMPKRIPKLLRMKIGKALLVYAALPLMSAWAFIPGYLLTVPIAPSLWAKDKIRYFKEWRNLR